MKSLNELLCPYGSGTFLSEVFERTPLFVRGSHDKFSGLFGWGDINSLLASQNLSFPHFRLVREGQIIPESEYATRVFTSRGQPRSEISVPKLAAFARDKVTFVLDGIDKMCPSVGCLASALEYETGARVQCNLYISHGATKGFDLHYDDHDVFILQISGNKDWDVRKATRKFPLPRDIQHDQDPSPEVLWQGTLSPGDFLYIPRGFWHVAVSQDLPSMHITVGMNGTSGVDFLEWLGDELHQVELWRKFLPTHCLSQNASRDSFRLHLKALCENLREFTNEPSIPERYLESKITTQKPREGFNFPGQVLSRTTLTANTKLRRPLYQPFLLKEENGVITLSVWRREFSFKSQAKELIGLIFASGEFTPEDLLKTLNGTMSWDVARDVFVALIEEGIIF